MAELKYRLIPQGKANNIHVPIHIVLIDKHDMDKCGICDVDAIEKIARELCAPAGISIFDMTAATTTSDGIMTGGAIVKMAAADNGKVNKDFGILSMAEIEYSDELIKEEPHLKQWDINFKGRKLYRGPNPKDKIIPVHNVVITGRASNNNSATEMMNIATMEEILLPILGQMQIMTDGTVVTGYTGEVISVGIGMTVKEMFGRVFPTRQFGAGDTAHGSGIYAKTLKKTIPCIVADKAILAEYIIKALDAGMVAGREIGCSPAVLAVSKALGHEIAADLITPKAYEELESIGITKESLLARGDILTRQEVIHGADEIIPGVENASKISAKEIVQIKRLKID
jgi:hypothetical protein